ncbi:unnamed protein product [Gordionus sp. m RMFG-2023]|uniref:mitochondrial intermediate peptidase-like n=1 Tax=Gordionus sp. m RMFG-2023 TaxID=3053472 RepID=UPI0030E0D800
MKSLGKFYLNKKYYPCYNQIFKRKFNYTVFDFNKLNVKTNKALGLFGISELNNPDGFLILEKRALNKCDDVLDQILSNNHKKKLIALFDDLSDTLCQVADLAEFIRTCHPQNSYSQAALKTYLNVSNYVEKLNTNVTLYKTLKNVVDNNDAAFPMDDVDFTTGKLFLFDFEQSGIHLSDDKRRRFVKLYEKQIISNNKVMEAFNEPVIVKNCSKELNDYVESCDNGFMVPCNYMHIHNDKNREQMYKLYNHQNIHKEDLLKNMLNVRHDLAQVSGFNSYADKMIHNTLAGSLNCLNHFFEYFNDKLLPFLGTDKTKLLKMKNLNDIINPYDGSYLIMQSKKNILQYNYELSNYLSLSNVLEGLNEIIDSLFGLKMCLEHYQDTESLWASNILKLGFYPNKGANPSALGYVYLDLFARNNKPSLDCHFTVRGGRNIGNESDGHEHYQSPIIVISLNLNYLPNINDCYLTPSSLENLFHEMGHAFHSILGRTRYQHVTGTRCSTDFAEIPSNLMEIMASDFRVLKKIGRHKTDRSSPPDDLLKAYLDHKNHFLALENQSQLYYSTLDIALHSNSYSYDRSLQEQIINDVQLKFDPYASVPGVSPYLKFHHLVGYGAKYYSYLIARGVAIDIWSRYFEQEPYGSLAGQKFNTLIQHGGEKDPSSIVKEVLELEAPLNINTFADSIIKDIERRYES